MMPMAGVDPDAKLDAREARQMLRRTGRMLRPYRRQLRTAVVLVVVYTLTTLAGPYLLKVGIDRGITRHNAGFLDGVVAVYVVVAIIAFVVNRAQVVLVSKVGEGFLRDMRVRVFDHLQRLSMPFYDREKAGVVVSRMTSDVDSLQELVQQGLLQFGSSILLIVFSVIVLALVSWQLLLICLIPVPFVVLASVKFQRDSNAAYLTVRDRIGLTLSSLQEGISGVRVIQAYGREDVETERFGLRNRGLYRAHMRSVWVQAWYLPVIELSALGCTALVIGLGGRLATGGTVTVGTIAFFVVSLSNLFEPVQQLSQLFNQVQSAGAGLHKLYDLLDTEVDVPEADDAVDLPRRGEIRVEGLSFAYGDGEPALRDVDLTIASGERLALVGPTGAGKSTLAKVIARLYDPTAGRVTFGGVDLRQAKLSSLRAAVTVVPQEGYLFTGTIRDNVRIGRPGATDVEVERALADIGVLDRFSALADGIDTEVRERGSRLSAGEKQLVSLARAALADPAVLVLDEATSSLDPGTEVLVERAMDRLMQGRTVIVIAHRLSTAERADRVGVVADARLIELGTHRELLGLGGRYHGLYENWVSGLAAPA
ncbi:MAG: putative transporter permease/ATP-binding protein [Acidimicrobiales bacterium]|nr:putative transporter permease/ATP-binding protein [Acidimicrobiales bacterium]